MATRMQQRRGTASQWTIADPVLAAGEIGVESDTAKFKIGDGINTWSTLDYFSATPDLTGYATETYVDDADAALSATITAAYEAYVDGQTADSATVTYVDDADSATLTAANLYVDTAISNLVDTAPATLDTLNELAAALGDDANFSATITNSIASKQADVITTAGDLAVGDVNGDASRLAIGTDGQTLAVENGAITWKDSGDNSFVVEVSGSNNSVSLSSSKAAGRYEISLSSGDTTFDIYLVSAEGAVSGYSNSQIISATSSFSEVVILGVSDGEIITFTYQGVVGTTNAEGNQPAAAAYLESINPSDLPSIDDTAVLLGGNFGSSTEITFESGPTTLPAKNVVVNSSTEIVVTRPDNLVEDDSPYTVRAVNSGVAEPAGSGLNLLVDAVTAGSDPAWVTSSPLEVATKDIPFSQTLEAGDIDGTVVDYSITSGSIANGLTLNSQSGLLSGTPTEGGSFTFTVTATDDGGNTSSRQFEQFIDAPLIASGGDYEVSSGGYKYHVFTSSSSFNVTDGASTAEFLILAGGGSGGRSTLWYESGGSGGGGGAGGLLVGSADLTPGSYPIGVGAGGASPARDSSGLSGGNSTVFGNVVVRGGGGGGRPDGSGSNGGSGGGGGITSGGGGVIQPTTTGLSSTTYYGTSGGNSNTNSMGGGGGGNGNPGGSTSGNATGLGGDGTDQFSDWLSAISSVMPSSWQTATANGRIGGGGGGGITNGRTQAGGAGGGGQGRFSPGSGIDFTGSGGGGSEIWRDGNSNYSAGGSTGGDGLVIVRYSE